MKKWMIGFFAVLAVLLIASYVIIPNVVSIQKSVIVNCSPLAVRRLLIENKEWSKGWPAIETGKTKMETSQSVIYDGFTYLVTDRKYSSLIISICRDADVIASSSLNIVASSKNAVTLDWEALLPTSYNPVKRWQMYFQSKKIAKDLVTMLNKMDSFFSDREQVYGINIQQGSVVDSTLLSTYDSCKGYPDAEFIYSLITTLKNYISVQHANITGYPMLNIYTKDSIIYLTKVALPVDRKLPNSGKITYKWMLPGGNILITEVKGDSKAIDSAFEQMEYFIKDYERAAPAIPFLSLITDRLQQKDSSKWVTRIYYPVMDL